MVSDKKSRTVLCLGPPHSGKSVFAYLLFKSLRSLNNKACVMDADYYSPTYTRLRVTEFAAPEEIDHIIQTPNPNKLEELDEKVYHGLCTNIHAMIEHKGIIVIDGVGKHSKSTESLLGLAQILIVLCPIEFDIEKEAKQFGFINNGVPAHPFDYYHDAKEKCLKILTHYKNKKVASFDQDKLQGELFDLDRESIKKGNVESIPAETRAVTLEIAKVVMKLVYAS